MKVILSAKSVYPFHPVGGVQKYVYYFAKALTRKGVDLEIVAPLDNGVPRTEIYEDIKYTFLRPSIYRYLEYPIGWLGVHLFSYSLARYLQDKEFDLLHAFDMASYRYLKKRCRKPVIAHIFTDNYLSNPITLGTAANLTASKFEQIKEGKVRITPFSSGAIKRKYLAQYLFKIKPMYFCLKNCERIFLEDDIFREEVNDLYCLEEAKSDIVPVGVDVGMINNRLQFASVSREELGLGPEDVVLITVNRLAADKGVDKIVLALEKILKKDPRVKLIIVGSGYQEKEIHEIIEQKGLRDHVCHFKDVSEEKLYEYYNISDIYISAFSYPGSSISTLEAMACSLPVITTAQSWLVRERQNGIALNSNDPKSIEEAVLKLVENNNLKDQGRISRDVVEDFDWDPIAEKALEQYKKLIP
ncbi:MAG: glycosyltransferase family 4 protein [Candidatus Omnitrophica bacterium]|nr:glycosyltransferase family 4 protein [Candidatus Omnitrophota bacterium]